MTSQKENGEVSLSSQVCLDCCILPFNWELSPLLEFIQNRVLVLHLH